MNLAAHNGAILRRLPEFVLVTLIRRARIESPRRIVKRNRGVRIGMLPITRIVVVVFLSHVARAEQESIMRISSRIRVVERVRARRDQLSRGWKGVERKKKKSARITRSARTVSTAAVVARNILRAVSSSTDDTLIHLTMSL